MADKTRDIWVRIWDSFNDWTKYGWREGQLYEIGEYYIEKVDPKEVKEHWTGQPITVWYSDSGITSPTEYVDLNAYLGVA